MGFPGLAAVERVSGVLLHGNVLSVPSTASLTSVLELWDKV